MIFATFEASELHLMNPGFKRYPLHSIVPALLLLFAFSTVNARDYNVSGVVTDVSGGTVPNATVSMSYGTSLFSSTTGPDGKYSLKISGVYTTVTDLIETGIPYPNPFSDFVRIPFIINTTGDIKLTIYNYSGQKIKEALFPAVGAGSYRILWDGCNQHGSPQKPGLYIYTLSFRDATRSGKLIIAGNFSSSLSGTIIEPVMVDPQINASTGSIRIKVVTNVTNPDYYPVRLTDISVAGDTIINFELTRKQSLPFKTSGSYIAMYTGNGYRPVLLKGINLGSSPPGYFPGEIAYAISPATYERWIKRMAEAGFNAIRVYTLHPPAFYEKLAEYNQRNPDHPLLLFQGIWLDEVEDRWDGSCYDLLNRTESFTKDIREVIDCIHGKSDIAYRYGKAYGRYLTSVSRWTAGFIIGREISPQEVDTTNNRHSSLTSYNGYRFSISEGSATEVFVTQMLDETVRYESQKYSAGRPVSFSSWPTLDPVEHRTEIYTDEDVVSLDITKISGINTGGGLFASYHAYPYYPNFISQQPEYLLYSDSEGRNSYLGYLNALKSHYSGMPLVIAEFGVPSSWGSAHQSYSNMHHGGYSEQQQGEKNLRMMHNIIDAGCAGGFMFSWIDEWFKSSWIVAYLEAFGTMINDQIIPTRQLWHNIASPEQNFGLISFDQTGTRNLVPFETDRENSPLKNISAAADNSFFYLEIETDNTFMQGDTLMIAFDTYLKDIGESRLPNGKGLMNRSEFLLTMKLYSDTAFFHVTQAYDMNGLTPRFDLSNHYVQMFRSTVTDGAPWKLMQWINDGVEFTSDFPGKLPMEKAANFTFGLRTAVAWSEKRIRIRLPWTFLYFYDPTQMMVIDGAVSYDGGYNYETITRKSDGIAVSVYYDSMVTSSVNRYEWPTWLIVPPVTEREKKSLQVVGAGLQTIPWFAE